MKQATSGDKKRWWVILADGSRKLAWAVSLDEAAERAWSKGLQVWKIEPAGDPLEDR